MATVGNLRQAAAMTVSPSPVAPAARAIDLRKTYGSGDSAVHALAGVTLDLEAGQFTAIMGPSGSGKSTLMHCMAALDSPSSGSVEVGGTDLSRLKDKDADRRCDGSGSGSCSRPST